MRFKKNVLNKPVPRLKVPAWLMLIVALLLVLRQNRSETGGEPMRRVDVLIDPGHGGPDAGAQGPDASERDVVLELAASLDRLLKRQGLTTRLTRTSNTTPEPATPDPAATAEAVA